MVGDALAASSGVPTVGWLLATGTEITVCVSVNLGNVLQISRLSVSELSDTSTKKYLSSRFSLSPRR